MTKELALDIVKLLSALESWCYSSHGRVPEFLSDKLTEVVYQVETIILKDEKDESKSSVGYPKRRGKDSVHGSCEQPS